MNGRLSALDDSFLAVESASAHMHVGWAAVFRPPDHGPRPSFGQLRDHIQSRLYRAPRYRQKLAPVPLGLNAPIWVDDPSFEVDRHVVGSDARRLGDLVDACMSEQLARDRPLWEIRIADRLEDGRIGLAGKVHHCMVDGLAAVELASLLLDPEPVPPPAPRDSWRPQDPPGSVRRMVGGLADWLREEASLAGLPARLIRSPARLPGMAASAARAGLALADAMRPARPTPPLNQPITPSRHLGCFSRPLDDLRSVARGLGVTVNDVLLAASAGGIRRYLSDCDERLTRLKTMVPVNLRPADGNGELGNRISFVFADLPCDEPDPVRRLQNVHLEMSERKDAGEPEGADAVMGALTYLPRTLRHAVSRMIAGPRIFNLTVSNIPGPREPMYMRGSELECAYPVVPISDEHVLSIGMTTIRDRACFGLYAARDQLPDSDRLAEAIDASIDELLERAGESSRVLVGTAPVSG
jgi:diacylglycerol O-acyltransferase / wax synthase